MQSPKEIFLELLKPDGKPERQLKQYEALHIVLNDPVNSYLRAGRGRGRTNIDRWGTTIMWPEDAPGPMPHITPETKVCPDVTRWQEYVHAPDLTANCSQGWEACAAAARDAAGNSKIVAGFMGTGIFEECHFLMGFEDTLTNLYEHPEEMHQLIEYITDYRIQFVKLLIDGLAPDMIFSHDDWGAKDSLFMKPEMWRDFFKEPYRRFYGYIRSRGVIALHHADSYLVPIVEDMAEIGIQVWQGVLPDNDIPALQRRLKGRMVLMGGIGAAIDRQDASEEEIRSYVGRTLKACCPGGHFIPSITYGLAGTVFPHVDPLIDDEIDKYNSVLHMPAVDVPPLPRRITAPKADISVKAGEEKGGGLLSQLSQALCRGQKKKVLELCRQGLDQGFEARELLDRGLVAGMTKLGDDFTAGRAFVPEMLMAARCMAAATELLKPWLVSGGEKAVGCVVLGTVKGDMHDIGKNLVKIMMEGCGLEVIDLGVDVSPEDFVNTAIEKNCGIIACSSLLTTTMAEMRRVVNLSVEKGIRDKIKIMIGGAPITQSFCQEIGADAYTADAGQAARVAVALLKST